MLAEEGEQCIIALDAFEKLISPTSAYSLSGFTYRFLQFSDREKRNRCRIEIDGGNYKIISTYPLPKSLISVFKNKFNIHGAQWENSKCISIPKKEFKKLNENQVRQFKYPETLPLNLNMIKEIKSDHKFEKSNELLRKINILLLKNKKTIIEKDKHGKIIEVHLYSPAIRLIRLKNSIVKQQQIILCQQAFAQKLLPEEKMDEVLKRIHLLDINQLFNKFLRSLIIKNEPSKVMEFFTIILGNESPIIIRQKLNAMIEPITFPISANFFNKQAVFQFNNVETARNVFEKLGKSQLIDLDEKKGTLTFDSKACQTGWVKRFLELYTFTSNKAQDSAAYLTYRAGCGQEYYKHSLFSWLPFSKSRSQRCQDAFQNLKTELPEYNESKKIEIATNVQHFAEIRGL